MNVAEWIIVGILSFTLFVFLIIGIRLMVKLTRLVNEAQEFVEKGKEVADKASGVASNLYQMTLVGSITGLAKRIFKSYNKDKKKTEED